MKSKKLSLKITNRKNVTKDIINMTEKIIWSGDYKQASRKLEFSVLSNQYDKNVPKVKIEEGYAVYFYEENVELFRGYIYSVSKKSNENIEYMAYDHAQKLVDIKVSYNFKEKTAKEITETILDDYKDNGLAKGTIVNDDVSYDKVFINVSAYETIMSAYTNAYYDNGIEYMCYSFGGKIYTAKKGDVRLKVKFQESNNIISVDYSSSIENMVNKVLVVDSSGNEQGHISNNEDIKQFGLFQEIYKIESNKDTEDEGKKLIKEEEQTASLEGYGDTTCITGYGVTVKDEYTGLDGLFYIDTDSHTWQNGEYKISLSLNFKNLMNEVSAGEDEQKEETPVTTNTDTDTDTDTNNNNDDYTIDDTSDLNVSEKQKKLVEYAKKFLGVRYVEGSPSWQTNTFDCASFVQYVYKKVTGITLQRPCCDMGERGKKITSLGDLEVGDLVYWRTRNLGRINSITHRDNHITHVTMYIGNRKMIHASSNGWKVRIDNIDDYNAMQKRCGNYFVWARRYL